MSKQAATQFLEKVASDEALRTQLLAQGKNRKERLAALVATGKQHGFTFGEDEMVSLLKTARGVEEGTLDERELAAVSGGGMSTFQYVVGKIWAWMGGGGSNDADAGTDNAVAGVRG